MKMRSILIPLLLASGSVMYAMQFPVFEDQSLYKSLVAHANGMLKPLPKQIKDAKDRLQSLLTRNPEQAAILALVNELLALHLQELEMNLTLIYVDRAARFGRMCEKKLTQLQQTIDALKNQEPLRATSGVELGSSSSAVLPEAVMPEKIALKPNPVATDQEEPEESPEPTAVPDEESDEEEEKKPEAKKQFEILAESKGKEEAIKKTGLYNAQLKEIQQEVKEGPKEGQPTSTWREYIMKKYQDTKDWYFGTGTESPEQKEE
jgi:hypothetical protein